MAFVMGFKVGLKKFFFMEVDSRSFYGIRFCYWIVEGDAMMYGRVTVKAK